MSSQSLRHFFNPRAVALIGASRDSQKIGRQVLDNIIAGGYAGKIYPVNLEGGKIAGHQAYQSISFIPGSKPSEILVVIAIPAAFVLAEIVKCAQRGIKNIIIISAGFKESGLAGHEIEEKIKAFAQIKKLNILGPNCLGFVNSARKLNATFSAAYPGQGRVALLSQSGAIGSAALDWLKMKKLSFRYFISLGNKAVLGENEILEYLQTDKELDLIVAYLEEIDDGERFMSLISRLVKHCPVAVLKAGTSAAGSKLARSHTGSIAGSEQAVRAGVKRAGAIWLDNLEDLFNLLTIVNSIGRLSAAQGQQKISVLSNAGGLAVLAADEISRQGLPFGRSEDLLGDAKAVSYQTAMEKTLKDKSINPLLVLLTPQTASEPVLTAQAIVRVARRYPDKIVLASFVGGVAVKSAREILQKNNICEFDFPEEAIGSWAKLFNYQTKLKLAAPYLLSNREATKSPTSHDKERFSAKNRGENSRQAGQLKVGKLTPAFIAGDYLDSFNLLNHYGITPVKTSRFESAKINRYSYPVVLKIVGPAAWHKSDRGGIILNLSNGAALKEAVVRLQKNNWRMLNTKQAYLVVQEQIKSHLEIIIGFKRDESFGPLLLVGQGGIYTQILKDWQISIGDLNYERALELIKSLRIYPILDGARGQKKYHIKALARALVNLARLAAEHPEIKEMDVNPLFINDRGVLAGDVRIIT